MSYQDAISHAAPFEVLDGTFPTSNPDSPLAARLTECEKQGRAALIGYLPVGFPTLDESIDAAIALGNNGADIIELGVPYSDPVMDGPVIQKATGVALENGFKLPHLFEAVRRITEATDAVVVVMTYWNPVLAYGVKNFARDLVAAGGAGMITPDLVPDEASAWFEASDEYGLDRIFLAALSSSPERTLVADIKAAGAPRACVGLGVSTRAHVEEIGAYADGVIVGTALVKALASGGVDAVAKLTRELAGCEG